MSLKFIGLLPLVAALSACSGMGVGTSGNDTSFQRVGAPVCVDGTVFIAGSATNPARCGPQAQPLLR